MVFITNKAGIEFEVPLELAQRFIQSGDIKGYTLNGEYIRGQVEYIPEEPKRLKNIIRKI